MISTSIRSGRSQALVSWAAAVILLCLIVWLAAALPVGALDVLSVGAAVFGLVVFVLISGEVQEQEPWARVTLVLGIVSMTLVLAGDALQHVFLLSLSASDPNRATIWAVALALRDWLGNGLFYASLILLGWLLVGQGRWWAGVLAIVNGVLGYLDMAFAPALGLPPHTNFLLLAVWEVLLGFTWWRLGSRVDASRLGHMVDHEQMADGRGMQDQGVTPVSS